MEEKEKVFSESKISALFFDSEEKLEYFYQIITKNAKNLNENLKFIIVDFDFKEQQFFLDFKNKFSKFNLNFHDFKEILEIGKQNVSPFNPPKPEHITTIIFQNPLNKIFQPISVSHRNLISFSGKLFIFLL